MSAIQSATGSGVPASRVSRATSARGRSAGVAASRALVPTPAACSLDASAARAAVVGADGTIESAAAAGAGAGEGTNRSGGAAPPAPRARGPWLPPLPPPLARVPGASRAGRPAQRPPPAGAGSVACGAEPTAARAASGTIFWAAGRGRRGLQHRTGSCCRPVREPLRRRGPRPAQLGIAATVVGVSAFAVAESRAGASRRAAVAPGGMSDTTAGAPSSNTPSRPTICSNPSATAPIVAAAASGNHQRSGRVASGTGASAWRGRAPTSRRAAARIAASSDGDGSSLDADAHAASKRGSRGIGLSSRRSVIGNPRRGRRAGRAVSPVRSAVGFSRSRPPRR